MQKLRIVVFLGLGLLFSTLGNANSPESTPSALDDLDKIVGQADSLTRFLHSPELREKYKSTLISYLGTDRFRCQSFDRIADRLKTDIKKTPLLGIRLWETQVPQKWTLQEVVPGQKNTRDYVIRNAARRLHALFLNPSMNGCENRCSPGVLLAVDGYAVALGKQSTYFVEAGGAYSGSSIHIHPILYKKKPLGLTWLSGDYGLVKNPRFFWDRHQKKVRSLSLMEALTASLRYQFKSPQHYLITWPQPGVDVLKGKIDLDLSLSADPLLNELRDPPLKLCSSLKNKGRDFNLGQVKTNLPLGVSFFQPANQDAFLNNFVAAEQALQTFQMSPAQKGALKKKFQSDVNAGVGKTNPRITQALLNLDSVQPGQIPWPDIPPLKTGNAFSDNFQNQLSRGAKVSVPDVSNYINSNWQNPEFANHLAKALQRHPSPGPLARGLFGPSPRVGGNTPSGRDLASDPMAQSPSATTPATPIPPAEREKLKDKVADQIKKDLNPNRCALWPVFEKFRPKLEASFAPSYSPERTSPLLAFGGFIGIGSAFASEDHQTPDLGGGGPRATSNEPSLCRTETPRVEALINDPKAPLEKLTLARLKDGHCGWVMLQEKNGNRDAVQVMPGSLLRGAEVPEAMDHPDCLYLLTQNGPLFLACDLCDKNYSVSEDRIVRALDLPEAQVKQLAKNEQSFRSFWEQAKSLVGGAVATGSGTVKQLLNVDKASQKTERCDDRSTDPGDWSEEDKSLFRGLESKDAIESLSNCYANAYKTSDNACTYAWRLCMRTCMAATALRQNKLPESEEPKSLEAVSEVAQNLEKSCNEVNRQLSERTLIVPQGCFSEPPAPQTLR